MRGCRSWGSDSSLPFPGAPVPAMPVVCLSLPGCQRLRGGVEELAAKETLSGAGTLGRDGGVRSPTTRGGIHSRGAPRSGEGV